MYKADFKNIQDFDLKCAIVMYRTDYGLTRKECEVVVYSSYNAKPDEIAAIMNRSVNTILKHMQNVKNKAKYDKFWQVVSSVMPIISDCNKEKNC